MVVATHAAATLWRASRKCSATAAGRNTKMNSGELNSIGARV
jgi:hypothetical protein